MHLNNLHRNGTAVVIGNGPSLRDVPDSFLTKHVTLGSNRIYLRHKPNYYAVVNPLVIKQNREEIEQLATVKFVRAGEGLRGYQLNSKRKPLFSFEPLTWIHEGYTVTYVLLQLAAYLGFATVLLVGVDHRYTFDGKPNERKRMVGDDPNHFDPAYFRGQEWNNPDLEKSAKFYAVARSVYEQAGRRIINLTEGSALDVFEKGDIAEWL